MATVDGIEVTRQALARARGIAEQAERDAMLEQHIAASLRDHADEHERSAMRAELEAKRYREWLAKTEGTGLVDLAEGGDDSVNKENES